MSRAIRFRKADGETWAVSFAYDAEAVELLKTHPWPYRMWVPESKYWAVSDMIAEAVVEDFKRAGFTVFGYEPTPRTRSSAGGFDDPFDVPYDEGDDGFGSRYRQPPPRDPPPRQPPPRASSSTDWAAALFAAIGGGPERREAVFKALTRVLHPDVSTGDTKLMQDLNAARSRWR